MKWIEYEDIEGNYQIDFDTNEHRRFKCPTYGIKVYEHGVIEVERPGWNNPTMRRHFRENYDLHFVLKKELQGKRFFDPETGKRVHKQHIHNSLLYYDVDLKRIYPVPGEENLRFIGPHAMPLILSCLDIRVPNLEKEKLVKESLKEHFALGETLNQVGNARFRGGYLGWDDQNILMGRLPIPTDLQNVETQSFCRSISSNRSSAEKIIHESAFDSYSPNYLNVREV